MDDFEKELKVGFLDEATQGIEEVEQCFLELESKPDDSSIIDKIFRLAHNLKGSSKAVGFNQLGEFTHVFENLLLKIKKKEVQVSPAVVSLLLRCNDQVKLFIQELRGNLEASVDSTDLLADLENAINNNGVTAVEETNVEAASSNESVVDANEGKIDLSYNQSIGEIPVKVAPSSDLFPEEEAKANDMIMPVVETIAPINTQEVATNTEKNTLVNSIKKEVVASDESIRVSLSKLEKLMNYVGEMVILQTVLREQSNQVASPLLRKTVHHLGRVSKEVQDLSMGLRMLPIKPIFQKMQRIVRDTSTALNKKIHFHMEGDETAVDKTVLDKISDPLVHLVRNAVDHGIEDKEKRLQNGKSADGTIHLRAFHRGDKLIIEVQDDGGGINPEVLFKKAVEKGVVKETQVLSKNEIVNLIFHPGFSTKAQTTDISGRGVGMDVVKTNIESMQGLIEIETEVNKGSVFRVILPLTLAIVDGLVIEANEEFFVIPLSQVRDSLRPKLSQVQFNKQLGETLILRGENVPLYRMENLLKRTQKPKSIDSTIVVVIKGAQKDFGLVVDDIVNQQQVVIKKLGAELQSIKGFSGSAILGSGRPALILEPSELINSYSLKNQSNDFNQKEYA